MLDGADGISVNTLTKSPLKWGTIYHTSSISLKNGNEIKDQFTRLFISDLPEKITDHEIQGQFDTQHITEKGILWRDISQAPDSLIYHIMIFHVNATANDITVGLVLMNRSNKTLVNYVGKYYSDTQPENTYVSSGTTIVSTYGALLSPLPLKSEKPDDYYTELGNPIKTKDNKNLIYKQNIQQGDVFMCEMILQINKSGEATEPISFALMTVWDTTSAQIDDNLLDYANDNDNIITYYDHHQRGTWNSSSIILDNEGAIANVSALKKVGDFLHYSVFNVTGQYPGKVYYDDVLYKDNISYRSSNGIPRTNTGMFGTWTNIRIVIQNNNETKTIGIRLGACLSPNPNAPKDRKQDITLPTVGCIKLNDGKILGYLMTGTEGEFPPQNSSFPIDGGTASKKRTSKPFYTHIMMPNETWIVEFQLMVAGGSNLPVNIICRREK